MGVVGTGALYGIAMARVAIDSDTYKPGEGVFSSPPGQRKIALGDGIPSAPVFSQKPVGGTGGDSTTDLYIGISGGAAASGQVKTDDQIPELAGIMGKTGASANVIHWRDLRVQP